MAKKKIRAVINFLGKKLREDNLKVSKIILFGSQVGGRASTRSDIDLIVISDDFRKKNIFSRVELIKKAEIETIRKFMIPLDIITMTPEEFETKSSLMAEYAHEGEIMYAG
jgi:uncharacterized protein